MSFKVGDKVYCERCRRIGSVTKIVEGSTNYPLNVHFSEREDDYSDYTLDGFYYCNTDRDSGEEWMRIRHLTPLEELL
jgi:hypothetical protein